MRNGLLVFFGSAAAARAKWSSLVQVLADPGSAGAAYVDVRLPRRPAAGFRGASTPSISTRGTEASGVDPIGSSEATIAAIAEALRGGAPQSSTPLSTGTQVGEQQGAGAGAASGEQPSSGGASAGAEQQRSLGASATGEARAAPSSGGGEAAPTTSTQSTGAGTAAGAQSGQGSGSATSVGGAPGP